MTDEKLTPDRETFPLHLADAAVRTKLAKQLADVMQTELERRVTDPDTETHKIITTVSEEPASTLNPSNLGPVIKVMRHRDSQRS